MLSHRGFSAWITVDDEALPEYLVAVDEEAHRVSCWIPGGEGKKFTVWWKDHGGKVDTCSFITLDGFVVPGRFLLGEGVASRSGAKSDPINERPFVFTKVPEEITPDDDTKTPNADVGTISVKIKRVNRVGVRPGNQQYVSTTSIPAKRKAGDLAAGFSAQQERSDMRYPTTWTITAFDPVPYSTKIPTYVTFVFRYQFLESQGIAEAKKKVPLSRVASRAEPRSRGKRQSLGYPESTPNLATPSPSPPKRRRLSGSVLSDQAALGVAANRRPSETRRSTSYYRNYSYESSSSQPSSVPSSQSQTPTHQSRTPTPSPLLFIKSEQHFDQRPPHLTNPAFFLAPRTPHTEQQRQVSLGLSSLGYGFPGQAGPSTTAVRAPSGLGSAPSTSALSDVTTPSASDEDDMREREEAIKAARSRRRPSAGGRV
ncbi:hypothetical protein D9611_004853 [Ephemerocybe angulata]|uniref:Uncharacterized protein n=1 Tax=Ephemerocybe angulata TaxID=980116 RepID=A0A8H5B3X8_9AGAR|nr:hypothetical protein D9611_004853 [Tulosesus angulatus]